MTAEGEPVNLAAIADACVAWLKVWRDPFAELSNFGPATARLIATLPSPAVPKIDTLEGEKS